MNLSGNNKLFAILIVALIVAGGYFWLTSGQNENKPGSPLAAVEVPVLTARAQAGNKAFDTNCASCHGINAAGRDGKAPPLIHRIYEPNHHGDMSFVMAAKNGVRAHHWPFGNMPPVGGITKAEIENIITFVRELQRANGIN
ncbi:MAG: cytochrome c [Sneathiella sp.]|uniref:cytochrome c n=1 Tax=Sneathiella sp. TaxID=1964365 RepID=UPI003001A4ED